MLKTLEEVFKDNLKRLRGRRTQAEIAEAAGIPLRSYQHAESGVIPQGPNRTAIARALGASRETELFMDPDLSSMDAGQALKVIARELESRPARDPIAERVARLTPTARAQLEAALGAIEESLPPHEKLGKKDEKALNK